MVATLLWPHELFRPRKSGWTLPGASVEGGRPIIGSTPQRTIFGGGGLNVAKLSDIRLRTRAQIGTWRAISLQLDGGAVSIVVPRCHRRSGPGAPTGGGDPIPHDDDTFFDDGTGYVGDAVVSYLLAPASFRATRLDLRLSGAERPLSGGEPFSIRHPTAGWRIYWVRSVEAATATPGGVDYQLTLRPPLRETAAAGDDVEWGLPRCEMRLASPAGMDFDEDLGRFADVSVVFVEDFSALTP